MWLYKNVKLQEKRSIKRFHSKRSTDDGFVRRKVILVRDDDILNLCLVDCTIEPTTKWIVYVTIRYFFTFFFYQDLQRRDVRVDTFQSSLVLSF